MNTGLHDLLKRSYKKLRHREPGIGASLAAGVASASMGQVGGGVLGVWVGGCVSLACHFLTLFN